MDYEDAARKLIMYSRGVAKGAIGTAYGMSMGEDPVLEYLSRHEDGMSPSDLAEKLGYTRPRMTRILDSLEGKGFVERIPDAKDRRRVIARCTEEGRCHAQDRQTDGVFEPCCHVEQDGRARRPRAAQGPRDRLQHYLQQGRHLRRLQVGAGASKGAFTRMRHRRV